jgi:cell division protein FtsB
VDHTLRKATERRPPTFAEHFRDFLCRNMVWFISVGLALLLLQDIFGNHGVLAMRRSQQEAREVERQIKQMNEENRQLEAKVKALKTDPQAIERIAREEMGLARPGEYIFKIQPKPSDGAMAAPLAEPNEPAKQP